MKTAQLIPLQSAAAAGAPTPGTIISTYFDLGDDINFSVAVSFTGSDVAGTLTLNSSNDPVNYGFVQVLSSSQAVVSSQGHFYNVTGSGYRYVNVQWVYTSGTGNIQAAIYVKDNPSK